MVLACVNYGSQLQINEKVPSVPAYSDFRRYLPAGLIGQPLLMLSREPASRSQWPTFTSLIMR